jgi:hypothetical protein
MPVIMGCKVYGVGDAAPFMVMAPADHVIAKVEEYLSSGDDGFMVLPGEWVKYGEDGEVEDRAERHFYVRAKHVWAVAPYLRDEPDDENLPNTPS